MHALGIEQPDKPLAIHYKLGHHWHAQYDKQQQQQQHTFIEGADAHGGCPTLRILQGVTIWCIKVIEIEQRQQLQHFNPRVSTQEIPHYLAVPPTHGLIRGDPVGGVTSGEAVAAKKRDGSQEAVFWGHETAQSLDNGLHRACGFSLYGAAQVGDDSREGEENTLTAATSMEILTGVVPIRPEK